MTTLQPTNMLDQTEDIPIAAVTAAARERPQGRCGFTDVPNVLPMRTLVAAGVDKPT
jgi:hypothetical protein